jgi:hypothetical protein
MGCGSQGGVVVAALWQKGIQQTRARRVHNLAELVKSCDGGALFDHRLGVM